MARKNTKWVIAAAVGATVAGVGALIVGVRYALRHRVREIPARDVPPAEPPPGGAS